MAVFMLDDVAGSVEVVVFPETFGKHGALIEADAMLLVRGKFEKDDESARLVATELHADRGAQGADDARSGRSTCRCRRTAGRRSRRSPSCCRGIAATAASPSSSTCKATATPLRVRADVAQRVRPSERLVAEVEQLCGAGIGGAAMRLIGDRHRASAIRSRVDTIGRLGHRGTDPESHIRRTYALTCWSSKSRSASC